MIAEIARRSAVHTGVDSGAAGGSGSGAARRDAESARRRAPTAALRRDLQIRDRTCAHPACRAPAVGTDQDHAVDYARGGRTVAANLGACCRHDHRLRHDGGWRFHRPEPERAVWVSSLGHTYVSRPPPVIVSLPEPWPATVEDPLPADDGWVDQPGPLWEGGRKHSGAGTPEDVVGTPCGAAFDPEKDPPPF